MNLQHKSTIAGSICFLSLLPAVAQDKPNVIFIAVDDMNDWVSPLGGTDNINTPNLDRLAGMGVTFTNAHCAAPASAPSRLSVMTGVSPARSGVMNNIWYDGPQWRNNDVLRNVMTLEQFFKANGYETLAGGKIYHTLAPPWLTINQGEGDSWDFWWPSASMPLPYQISAPEEVSHPADIVGTRPNKYFTWGPIDCTDDKMIDHQLVEWAKYELGRERSGPLFMAVGFFRPHMPWEVPQKYFDMYPLDSIQCPEICENDLEDAFDHGRRNWHRFVLRNDEWKHVLQAYKASISFADAQIGRLLDAIEASRYRENTVIVLWSDHGMHMGEKENWEKFTLWEESTRVPLFFYVPGVTQGGVRNDAPVSLIDIYPTLADLIGKTVPETCDGESLVPLLKGEKVRHEYPLTAYRFDNSRGYSVRTEKYRYIYYPEAGLEELYDHESDPDEFFNIAYEKEHKKVVRMFRRMLAERVSGLQEPDSQIPGYKISEDGAVRNENFKPLEIK